jgi:hypothetical protein
VIVVQRTSASAKQREKAQKMPAKEAPVEQPKRGVRPALIDNYLPNADIVEIRHIVVNAPPEATYAALRCMDFAEIRSLGIRVMQAMQLRAIRRARRRLGLEPLPVPAKLTFDNLELYGRVLLAEEPGVEIVIGAIERPWDVKSLLERRTPSEFAAFDCPGYIKAAASFLLMPYGARQTLVSYETRIRAVDTATRRKLFAIYSFTAPSTRLFMQRTLEHVKESAERAWRGCIGGPSQ